MKKKTEVLYSIQSLRGIAASMVVLYHSSSKLPDDSVLSSVRTIGNAGVDIFFVISGFVIYLTTQRSFSPADAHHFLLRRIIRIVPAYWFYTTIAVAAALCAPQLFGSYVFDLGHAIASFMFIPFPRTDGTVFPVLYLGWSLNFEMLFYIIFAILMLYVPRSWVTFSLMCIFTILNFVVLFAKIDDSIFIFGNTLVFEFVAGCFVAKLWTENKTMLATNIAWFGFILSFGVLMGTELFDVVEKRAFKWGLPSAFIVYFALSLEEHLGRFGKVMGFAGDISYSLYLTHLFTVPACLALLPIVGLDAYSSSVSAVICLYAASIIVAAAAYKLVEEPVTRFLRRRVRGRT